MQTLTVKALNGFTVFPKLELLYLDEIPLSGYILIMGFSAKKEVCYAYNGSKILRRKN
ncbi:MAG: hypothetical protein ACTTH7_03755 [Treponema sp.]